MRRTSRTTVVAALVLGLVLPTASAAVATAAPQGRAVAAAGEKSGKLSKKPRKVVVPLSAGGTVTAVDAAAGTLTLTVKGGRDKALRDAPLTVTLAKGAKVTRAGAVVELSAVQVGDRVHVMGTRTGTGYSVVRVSAAASDDAQPQPEPTPVPQPTPTPTQSATPAPGA